MPQTLRPSVRTAPSSVSLAIALALPLAAIGAARAQPAGADPAAAEPAAADEVLTLDAIVISANRVPTPEREVASAVTIIDGAELERRQIRLVSDALRGVPGVAVDRSGTMGGKTQVHLRGSESNQTLVLIDGIEVNDPIGGSEFDFAHLLARDVERIEVLRGPQSALYGSDAIGGVVNIVTRRGAGAPRIEASAEGGSRGTALGHASVAGGGEGYDFIASAAGIRTDGFSSAAEWRGNPERDGYRNGTLFAKLGLDPLENLRIDLVGRVVDFKAETDGFVGGIGAVDADEVSDGRQFFGRAQAKLDLLDGRLSSVFGVTRTHQSTDYFSGGAANGSYDGDKTKVDWQSTLTAETPEVLDARHAFTLAAEHEIDAGRVESAWSSFDRDIGQTGLVGQYRLALMDALFLTGSVRHDINELFGDATTWRATAAYAIEATGTKLRASAGTGVKNPTLFELYGFTSTYRGNPDLDPETARGFDIGFDQVLFDDRARLDVTLFDQRIGDLITGSGDTSVNMPGTSRIRGLEVGLTLTPVEDISIRAAYTLLKGEDATGAELIRRPSNTASLDVTWRFLEGRGNVSLGVVYNGETTDWAYDAMYDRTVVNLDAYTIVNLAASYRLGDNAEIYGRIENLFDEKYEQVHTYGGTGRSAFAGLRVSF